jgi:hypothetical protein
MRIHTGTVQSAAGRADAGNAEQATILDFVRAHLDPSGCGLLPGGEDLPGTATSATEVRWMAGARDGVASHHFATTVSDTDIGELITLMGRTISRRFRPVEFGKLYERLRTQTTLAYVDELVGAVARSALPRSGVGELARRLAANGRHPEPVKTGIALLAISGTPGDRDLLLTLGRHEELTLYCAVAIAHCQPQPDRVLWSLARTVDGWGRIQTIERLAGTGDEDISDWIVRHGFRNKVMIEYLAYIAATTGRLADRLEAAQTDDELVDAAGEIISALISGGPAQDIDDLQDAPRLLEAYLRLTSEQAARLGQFVAVDHIRGFLDRDDGWPERYQRDWTAASRTRLTSTCAQILAWPRWRQLAVDGLQANDDMLFWTAAQAAQALGIDTFDAHWRRLQASPLTGHWFTIMQVVDGQRIGEVLQFATDTLNPAGLATGPAQVLGLGPDYAAHNALSCVLQGLGRFPGQGWSLFQAGLRNPVTRVRNLAVLALRQWPADSWPPAAARAVTDAAHVEPDDEIHQAMIDALAEAGHQLSPP